jgi:hypothetical protein
MESLPAALAPRHADAVAMDDAREPVVVAVVKQKKAKEAQSFSPWSEPDRHNIPRAYDVRPLGLRSQPMASRGEEVCKEDEDRGEEVCEDDEAPPSAPQTDEPPPPQTSKSSSSGAQKAENQTQKNSPAPKTTALTTALTKEIQMSLTESRDPHPDTVVAIVNKPLLMRIALVPADEQGGGKLREESKEAESQEEDDDEEEPTPRRPQPTPQTQPTIAAHKVLLERQQQKVEATTKGRDNEVETGSTGWGTTMRRSDDRRDEKKRDERKNGRGGGENGRGGGDSRRGDRESRPWNRG